MLASLLAGVDIAMPVDTRLQETVVFTITSFKKIEVLVKCFQMLVK